MLVGQRAPSMADACLFLTAEDLLPSSRSSDVRLGAKSNNNNNNNKNRTYT